MSPTTSPSWTDRGFALLSWAAAGTTLGLALYAATTGWTPAKLGAGIGSAGVTAGLFALRRASWQVKQWLLYLPFLAFALEALLQLTALLGVLPDMNLNAAVPFGRIYQNREGYAHGVRNRHGWNSLRSAFSPEAHKVLLIGDSFLEAPHVPRSLHLDAVLEDLLRAATPDRSTEVMALGRSGFGPAQYLELARYGVRAFNPDQVVVFVFVGNDLRSAVLAQEIVDKPNHDPAHWIYYQLDARGDLALHPKSRKTPQALQRKLNQQHAGLWANLPQVLTSHYLTLAIGLRLYDRLKSREPPTPGAHDELGELGLSSLYFRLPLGPEAEAGLTITTAILAQLGSELSAQGKSFAVVTIPVFTPSFYATQSGKGWQSTVNGLDLRLPEHELSVRLGARGIRTLLMGQALQQAGLTVEEVQQLYFFAGSGHFTAQGHAACARIVAAQLFGVSG